MNPDYLFLQHLTVIDPAFYDRYTLPWFQHFTCIMCQMLDMRVCSPLVECTGTYRVPVPLKKMQDDNFCASERAGPGRRHGAVFEGAANVLAPLLVAKQSSLSCEPSSQRVHPSLAMDSAPGASSLGGASMPPPPPPAQTSGLSALARSSSSNAGALAARGYEGFVLCDG